MTYQSEVLADSPLGYWRLGDVPQVTATASTFYAPSSETPSNAIDGNAGTYWTTNGTQTGWLRLQFGSAKTLTGYSIRRRDDIPARNATAWTFEGSNDGSSWTVLDTRSGITWPTAGENKSFTFSNSTAYTYYRLNITANGGDTYLSVAELDTGTSVLADSSGNARSMAPVGGVSNTAGLLTGDTDGAAALNGTGYARASGGYASWMSPTAVTVEAIIKTSTADRLIVNRDDNGARAFQFGVNSSGALQFITINGGAGVVAAATTATVHDNVRHHVVATYDASSIRLYIDGVLVKTQAASGALSTQAAVLAIGANFSGGGATNLFNGTIDEVAYYGTALSDTRIAAHAAAMSAVNYAAGIGNAAGVGGIPTDTAGIGNTAGTASTPAGSTSGVGNPGGAGSSPTATSGIGNTAGWGASTEPETSVTGIGNPAGVGGVPTDAAGIGNPAGIAAAPHVTAGIGNAAGWSAPGAPDLVSAHSVTETSSTVSAPITADPISAHSVTETSSVAGTAVEVEYVSAHSVTETSSTAVPLLVLKLDPISQLPAFRLLVVDRTGQQQRELRGAQLGDATYRRNGDHDFSFSIPKNHARADLLTVGAEVQVWSGDTPLRESWFLIVADPIYSGSMLSYKCKGLRAHLDDVVIGKPRPELIRNGGFEDGIKHWHPTWLAGSAAEAPPDVSIVSGAEALAGGKALRTTAVEKVVVKDVQTAAIFYGNRPDTSEPLADGYLPGGEQIIRDQVADFAKGTAILVEGFTADVDSGTGLALSQRRADAAKATILAYRPDLVVTAIGRGESIQVAPNNTPENQAKNRRIVITGNATRVGHRQIVNQWFTYTNMTRVATALDLSGWLNLIDYVGPSKDGWGLYINRRKATDPHKILDEQHTDIEATFPKQRWTPDSCSILAPNDSAEHVYEVRLYGTAGDTKFDEVSCKPNVLTAWYNVTKPTLIAGLIAHAQDVAFGKVDLNIETNCPSFGPRDDFEYAHKDHRKVNDALDEQLRADDAPDFAIVTTATRRIATTWARRGRRNPIHFELGGIVESYTGGGDIDDLATTGIVTSNLNGGGSTEAYAYGPTVNGLVLERAQATEPNRTKARAGQLAAAMVRYGRRTVIDSVTCRPGRTEYLLGRVWIGDTVRRTIRDGRVNADGWGRVDEVRLSFARRQLTYGLTEEE